MGNTQTKEARPEPQPTRRQSRSKQPQQIIMDPTEMVDGGYLFPQGVYTGPQDFKISVVRERIIRRQIAPFYKGLSDYDPNWDELRVLDEVEKAGWHPPAGSAASAQHPDYGASKHRQESVASEASRTSTSRTQAPVKVPANPQKTPSSSSITTTQSRSLPRDRPLATRVRSNTTSLTTHSASDETRTQTIWLYRGVHECPICFLLYPRLNSTNCCSQSICTECFVQIKRAAPHPPHNQPTDAPKSDELVSEPACCPYCQCAQFAVVFEAPPFEWGIPKPRHSAPAVITNDMLRPDWESRLAHARRKVAKRSAAAHALHQSALLPSGTSGTGSRETTREPRRLTPQEIEQQMIDQAIQASLKEQ